MGDIIPSNPITDFSREVYSYFPGGPNNPLTSTVAKLGVPPEAQSALFAAGTLGAGAGIGSTNVPGGVGGSPGFLEGFGTDAAGFNTGADPGFMQGVGDGFHAPQTGLPNSLTGGVLGEFGGGGNNIFDAGQNFNPMGPSISAPVGGFDFELRNSQGGAPTPLNDLSPESGRQGGIFNGANQRKALLALQAIQTGRGLLSGNAVDEQNPQGALMAMQQQLASERQRSFLAALPRDIANASSRGLSGISPQYFQGMGGNNESLEEIMQLLNSGRM